VYNTLWGQKGCIIGTEIHGIVAGSSWINLDLSRSLHLVWDDTAKATY
jgi:hypothetical protein